MVKEQGGASVNNYERIKSMSIEEMAKILTELQCQECGVDNWKECNQIGCWCHKNNGYQSYYQWLQAEA